MNKNVQIALSLGSNINRYTHINAGIKALVKGFGGVKCSPVYESESVGFNGNAFLNLIALIETNRPINDVISILKQIEDDNGRDRTGPKFSPRTLDIDVVTYGDYCGVLDGIELPRPELFNNAFVSLPLAILLPEETVPGRSVTFSELWAVEGNKDQVLEEVSFNYS